MLKRKSSKACPSSGKNNGTPVAKHNAPLQGAGNINPITILPIMYPYGVLQLFPNACSPLPTLHSPFSILHSPFSRPPTYLPGWLLPLPIAHSLLTHIRIILPFISNCRHRSMAGVNLCFIRQGEKPGTDRVCQHVKTAAR